MDQWVKCWIANPEITSPFLQQELSSLRKPLMPTICRHNNISPENFVYLLECNGHKLLYSFQCCIHNREFLHTRILRLLMDPLQYCYRLSKRRRGFAPRHFRYNCNRHQKKVCSLTLSDCLICSLVTRKESPF